MEATAKSRRLDPVTLIYPIPSFSQVLFSGLETEASDMPNDGPATTIHVAADNSLTPCDSLLLTHFRRLPPDHRLGHIIGLKRGPMSLDVSAKQRACQPVHELGDCRGHCVDR